MKLYEVNEQILDLVIRLEPDPETGEIPFNFEELEEELGKLLMKRQDILTYLAKIAINTKAEAEALKDEEKRLAERRKALEKRQENLMAILDRECQGQKTDLGIATVSYRRTEKVEITDYHKAFGFLRDNNYDICLRHVDPEISKKDVKELIKVGVEVPGVELVQGVSCSLR